MEKLTFMGTGSAMVTKCYNTCFTISNNDEYFLVDAGGTRKDAVIYQEHRWE